MSIRRRHTTPLLGDLLLAAVVVVLAVLLAVFAFSLLQQLGTLHDLAVRFLAPAFG